MVKALKEKYFNQEIHSAVITMFIKLSLEWLTVIRNTFLAVSLLQDGSSWKCISITVAAIRLGEETGPQRAECAAFDAAKASMHALPNTVKCDVKSIYTQ